MNWPEALLRSSRDDDPRDALAIADQAEAAGDRRLAATALDRAYGCAPTDETIRRRRQRILDGLAVEEHGLVFRYVPAGIFLRGSDDGDPDEGPVAAALIDPGFWLSETTISWGAFCRLLDWTPPPAAGATPKERSFIDRCGEGSSLTMEMARRVRLQYCEDFTQAADGWHAHDPVELPGLVERLRKFRPGQHVARIPDRPPDAPWRYEAKPMVAVSSLEAEALAAALSTSSIRYSLPTEAQWEKAARGGLIGCRYAWGDEPPTPERCDFGRFEPFMIKPSRTFAPNGYGLYAMCGSVWEWTTDYFLLRPYSRSQMRGPERVLRGGSWTDPADVVTVSFRMSREGDFTSGETHVTPNIGFRLCRQERYAPGRPR